MLLDKAIERKNRILEQAGSLILPDLDAAIRRDYNIYFR